MPTPGFLVEGSRPANRNITPHLKAMAYFARAGAIYRPKEKRITRAFTVQVLICIISVSVVFFGCSDNKICQRGRKGLRRGRRAKGEVFPSLLNKKN